EEGREGPVAEGHGEGPTGVGFPYCLFVIAIPLPIRHYNSTRIVPIMHATLLCTPSMPQAAHN
ncbi:uncharacterized protein BO96DRAFT_489009, partial [Aspergillus niger CBS 101883]|uniref:Uncharacterized protein n=2 Tax=Aspergillus niger TaxID=5061 RepID=A0AAJ8DYT8_ASPNG